MIVKDEEESLPQCLSSVKDVVDEMVVLDTGSTDRTIEVAQSYGARVYQFEWCNDFAAARNQALKYVQGEWVLVLDAD
ncbi:MAG: glycosyltransferase family 2 protein, partial [Moorea sp. SIO3E2]|nr:glycosyltransferase family 2 protein [Moorena sp. SIO3E2]